MGSGGKRKRNEAIAEMLADGDQIKNFYRFAAQNPHINLHDGCQIILAYPSAGVCFSYRDWNDLGRRVARGSQGIPYIDLDGEKCYVFDATCTYGENYRRLFLPMKHLLEGLDELNGTENAGSERADYEKITRGVEKYLSENNYLTGSKEHDELFTEGVAYSLYCKTGFPKNNGIKLRGLPYSLQENSDFFKEVYIVSSLAEQEIEDAYQRRIKTVKVIDDSDEPSVSDEVFGEEMPEEATREETETDEARIAHENEGKPRVPVYVKTASAATSNYKGYVALFRRLETDDPNDCEVYLGKTENYDGRGHYDNADGSLIFLSNNPIIFDFLYGKGWVKTQQEMLEMGYFSEQDYKEFFELEEGVLKGLEKVQELRFGIGEEGDGLPFVYPHWQGKEEPAEQAEPLSPSHEDMPPQSDEDMPQRPVAPFYKIYTNVQKAYPNAVVFQRLGDFYEAMGDKAVMLAEELDLTLTSRDVGLEERVPMIGIPYYAADAYLGKLLSKYTIAFVEEGENVKVVHPKEDAFSEEPQSENGHTMSEEYDEEEGEYEDEQPDFVNGIDTHFPIHDDYDDDDVPQADADEELADYYAELEAEQEEAEREKEKANGGKGKKKPNPQLSFFDFIDGKDEETEPIPNVDSGIKPALQDTPRERLIKQVIMSASVERKRRLIEARKRARLPFDFAGAVFAEYRDSFESEADFHAQFDPRGVFLTRYDEDGNTEFRTSLSFEEFADRIDTYIANGEYLYGVKLHEIVIDLTPKAEEEQREPVLEQTDLNKIGFDQKELGGAKTRFRNNVTAIRLANRLYAERREPTDEERKVLAQFVGWGGLPQAFDERKEDWAKEYAELKGLLSPEDYEFAKGSTLNAHYTSKEVIDGIYHALDRFGVKGNNRILEPAMGTGNFFGYMPQSISEGSKLYGVELDPVTGKIASKLYPKANIQIKGYEDTTFPNDRFDVVVGNVPFGGYTVYDSEYARHNFYIHDFFLAKSIDKLRKGGVMAVITSKGTMDKANDSVRRYLAERAELLGAIRLPNNAFKQNAGTEVVSDILFFRKRDGYFYPTPDNTEWLTTDKTEDGFEVNSYFVRHPEMVLGTFARGNGLYGAEDVTVNSDGRDLALALREAVERLPKDVFVSREGLIEDEEEIQADYSVKPLCYKAVDGKLYMRIGEKMVEQPIPKSPKDAYERISAMIQLRDELHHVLDVQIKGCSDDVLKDEQRKLNANYDRFVRRYGNLNSSTNTRLFKDDGDSALLFSCENIDEEPRKITKADVFSKRTIRPYTVATSTDDCFEALQISKNERGRVDISYIEELTGKDYDTVIAELGETVFRDPEKVKDGDKYSGFVTSEEYLSGQVKRKLKIAEEYAAQSPDKRYDVNVKALKEVQPTPIKADEISVRLGASWIDSAYYKEFFCEMLNVPMWARKQVSVYYNPHDSSWRLDQTPQIRSMTEMRQKSMFGTKRVSAARLFEDCLNLRTTAVYDLKIDEHGNEKRVINQTETIAAREKQNQIKELFKKWIFTDPHRREELEETYNDTFNQIRLPTYDGSYLRFPEMNPAITLRPHQMNAIHRTIVGDGSTLLHHVVGSGKTYTMIGTAMKLRQYGLAKKPLFAVPNHLTEQWAAEWRKLYPNAKILVARKEDLDKENREKFVSKVAMGDWDAVIMAQSSFAKIPVSKARQIAKLEKELSDIETTIRNRNRDDQLESGSVKNLERIKKSREAALKKLMDDSKKDGVLIFENLGVDYLFIDEAHYYKNLFLYTKMNNVAGISATASQRATDLKLKCEYIQELHGSDKGIVFATGTPISNSMTEMFTMQSYLQPSVLKNLGIDLFDNWAADFGETVTALELAPSGQGYRNRTRFAKFVNLPELLSLYRSVADVQTADMVCLNVPEAEKVTVDLKPSETVVALAEEIADRAAAIYSGGVDPTEDNMLKVTTDGKKLALDPRCFEPTAKDEEGNKLNTCADNIAEVWRDTAETKGTQIVFCDLSTPSKKFEDYEQGKDFDAYNELKCKLIERGIPAEEIAFIHDANSDEQKQALFDKVNSGAIRVLVGSTEKCGAGTNVQKRLIALHHLDAPYRPSDLEQREGRIIRQGNTNKKVKIFTYVTERTFDSYSYQILENKQRFISQINRGEVTVREAEDIDETTMSYAKIKAITAANPKIREKMEVDSAVSELRVLEGQYRRNLYELQAKVLKSIPEDIRRQELYLERLREDAERIKTQYSSESFTINVNGKVYTDRKEGGKALTEALLASAPETPVAEFCGFKISIDPMPYIGKDRSVTLAGSGQYTLPIGDSAVGNLSRLDNFMTGFSERIPKAENKLQVLRTSLQDAKEQMEKPFEHEARLMELLNRQSQLNEELSLDRAEESAVIGEEETDEDDAYRALPPPEKQSKEMNFIEQEEAETSEQKQDFSEVTKQGFQVRRTYTYGGRNYIIAERADDFVIGLGYDPATGTWAQGIYDFQDMRTAEDALMEDLGGRGVWRELPIYLETYSYARQNGEREQALESHRASTACARTLAKEIGKNFDGSHLETDFLDGIIRDYGLERVAYIVATTVSEAEYDGRYSSANKEWAKSVPQSKVSDERWSVTLPNHPAILNGVADIIRQKIKEREKEEKMAKEFLIATVSGSALTYEGKGYSFFKMPKDVPEYRGYTYKVFHDRMSEAHPAGYSDEMVFDIEIPEGEKVTLSNRQGETVKLPARDFAKLINMKTEEQYIAKPVVMELPAASIIDNYERSVRFRMPNDTSYKGQTFFLPNSMLEEDSNRDDGSLITAIPDDFRINVKKNKDDTPVVLSAKDLAELFKGKTAEDFAREPTPLEEYREQQEKSDAWTKVEVSPKAVIRKYPQYGSVFLKMPKGEYEGYTFFLSEKLLEEKDGKVIVSISPDYTFNIKNLLSKDEKELNAEEFFNALNGKTDEDYASDYRQPSEEAKKQFERVERNLRENAPKEMLARPNWVVVKTKENENTHRLDKFLIDVQTGKFAKINDPETWTDFNTACEYAKENGGVALAYALDGNDKIACIDLDGCIDEDGTHSELAQDLLNKCEATYIERSVSGKGLHFFGKTDGTDVRAFSKEGDLEFYQGGHFMTMTGDAVDASPLMNFDRSEVKPLLEEKCGKQVKWENRGKGEAGLSSLDDQQVLKRATEAKNGETFKAYYAGQDLKNNRSNSDMAFMNMLAFWCGHDKDQMLRIFATSGLYRPDKPNSYYEYTALKAVKSTPTYTPPKASASAPKPTVATGSGKA